jgi:recombination protein RecT
MTTTSTTVATKAGGKMAIRDHLNSDAFKNEVARVLPKHCTPERMVRTGLTALMKTPKLASCTPESFLNCMLQLSQWGLEPDGRHAHLIPYGDVCTLILDYKGIVDLVLRSGTVRSIHADVVHEGDLFVYDLGEVTKHTPHYLRTDETKPEKAGKIIAAYCRVVFNDGGTKSEVMSVDEVEKVRAASRAGGSGPWKDWWSEMAKKTVFRRASKWLKLSAEVADAFERDDQQFHQPQARSVQLSKLNQWQPLPVIEAESADVLES